MTTLRDLAKTLGLSVTQVSRALDDKADVSAKTKARVREEADRRGYLPNAAARMMRKQKTDTIGVVLPSGSNAIGLGGLVELMYAVAREFAGAGYHLMMIPGLDPVSELNALKRIVDGRRVDAVIVVRTRRDDDRVRFLIERGIPFVAHGRTEVGDHAFVDGDGAAGFAEATRVLAALGHTRIAHIGAPATFNFAHVRREGWRHAMAELDLDTKGLETADDLTERGGYTAARALLEKRDAPTALLCATDTMAIGAYSAAMERGLVPGRSISIIGHDDLPVSQLLTPQLTTMKIAGSDVGKCLAQHVLACLAGADPKTLQTLYQINQIARASHGPAPKSRPSR